jgi:hypothetical protein
LALGKESPESGFKRADSNEPVGLEASFLFLRHIGSSVYEQYPLRRNITRKEWALLMILEFEQKSHANITGDKDIVFFLC